MKSLNIYSEDINDSTVGSIKDNILKTPIKDKELILDYLHKGKIIGAFCGIAKDIFTNQNIKEEWLLLTDGTYEWTSDITYYFEKYNLKLSDDFIKHIGKCIQANKNNTN